MTQLINQEVNVNAFYFAGREMKTFPKAIEYRGRAVTFGDGLRYLVQKGSEAVRLFDMSSSDGSTYRLQQAGGNWTLVGIKGGN